MVLSSIATYELEGIIASGNANALKAVKGIGTKTAERIILDLKDKIKISSGSSTYSLTQSVISSEAAKEAVAALTMLGFNLLASQKVIAKIEKEHPAFPVEELIKNALKVL
jgi:Holliday junction DNA helicase RuvA